MPKATPNRLREFREQSKLTQEEVAKILEINSTTVSKHESLDRALSKKDIIAYAQLYKRETYEILIELPEEGDADNE